MSQARFAVSLGVAIASGVLGATSVAAQKAQAAAAVSLDSASIASFHYRFVGPEGNRIASVAGVNGDPTTYYAGAASGGLWKTTDAGAHWKPVFDAQPVQSIGQVAVAPSDPNVVWVGTGEPWIRSNISIGWGMFKSTDAGATWTRAGLENTGRIARIVIDPRDADRVFVAALGTAYGPQPDRGIFRTTDGGKTWEKVLFVNDSTGGADIAMDPTNPRILYASMWQIEVHTWGRFSGGAGSGIWKSTDGGTTWKRLTDNGLPTRQVGKISLGMSAANPQRVYAAIETGDGVPLNGKPTDNGHLFRSDDAGQHWTLVSSDHRLGGRTHYYNRMAVTPDNADEAYFAAGDWSKTLDGGRTIIDPTPEETPAGDHHDIWFDQTNGNRFIVSHDAGASITINRGRTWQRIVFPVGQMYHVTVDDRIPYWVYGNEQDAPSAAGPSNAKLFGGFDDGIGIPPALWRTVGGGESGWATPDPADTNLVWSTASGAGAAGGIVTRYNWATNSVNAVEVWPNGTMGWPAAGVKYRFNWTFPITISPFDHARVYVGSQFVHVTSDGGKSWSVMSPDLTRHDTARLGMSGGLTPDNLGVEYSGVVFAIAESPKEKGLIWAGTNDGLVHVTRDGGKTWTNVTASIPGMLPWGTVSNIEPSRYDAGTAFVTVDGHQVNNRDPWIYKTTDYGKTWKLVVNGIPKSPLSYVHVVREDPVRRGLLFAGTENGVYVSFDDAEHWQAFQSDLPHAPVHWLVVQPRFGDLVIATYGRGFYIVDDISPLRTMSAEIAAEDLCLFAPRATYRLRGVEVPFMHETQKNANYGEVPPEGVPIEFAIKNAAKGDSATITVTDASGRIVRTMKAPATSGLNRAWWDLRSDVTTEARIRVSPPYSPWLMIPAEGKPAPNFARVSLLEPPGVYTVSVSFKGKSDSKPLTVMKDPASGGSETDIAAQTELNKTIIADIDTAAGLVNSLEIARAQIALKRATLPADSTAAAQRSSLDSLDKKLLDAESELRNTLATGRGQDMLRFPVKTSEKLIYFSGTLGASDFAPTESQKAVAKELHDALTASKAKVDALLGGEVKAFQKVMGN